MAPQPMAAPAARRPVAAALLLAAAAVFAATALSGSPARSEPSAPALSFLVGSSLPRTGASRPGQELASVVAGVPAFDGEARATSPVALRGKRMKTWDVKQLKNHFYALRNPKPVLPKRELRKRVTKVKLMRREDEWVTEVFMHYDPRDKEWQMPIKDVKRMMETPDFQLEDRVRESLGVPLAPIRLYQNALEEMRGERRQASARTADQKTDQEKKKMDKGIDLSNIDEEFLNFKGIELSKKDKAKKAANRAQKRNR